MRIENEFITLATMNKLYFKTLLVWISLYFACSNPLSAQVINEFVLSHAGPDINEYIEVLGEPNTNYSTLSLLIIDGNNVGTLAGRINRVFPLGTTDASGYWTTGVSDFGIINESLTILLVSNFNASEDFDLDFDNNGSIDTLVWASVLDGVAIRDGDRSDRSYSSVILRQGFRESSFTVEGASRFPNGQDTDSQEDWQRNDRNGAGLPDVSFANLSAGAGESPNTPGIDNRFQEIITTPHVFFTVSQQSVLENDGQVSIQVGLTHPNSSATRLDLVINQSLSTADSLTDYINLDTLITLRFPPNTLETQTIQFDLVNDTVREFDEVLILSLEDAENGVILDIPQQQITIIDDDNPPSSFLLLNEILYNPDGSDTGGEYIELRGDVFSRIPPNTYLVAIEGDISTSVGQVQTIFNLSNLSLGDNGFLVLTQANSDYRVDPQAQEIKSSATGWTGLPFFQVGGSTPDIENVSVTFLLIASATPPLIGDDIDTDNNGSPDGSIFTNWTILDGISLLDDGNDFGYAPLIFSPNVVAVNPVDSEVVQTGTLLQSYAGRRGDSTNSSSSNWVVANVSAQAPDWLLTPASTFPASFGGLALNHIGSKNFNEPTGPILSFTQTALTRNELGDTLTFRVTILNENTNSTAVNVVVDDASSTATANEDYVGFNNPPFLFFPANDGASKVFDVIILDDLLEEINTETLVLRLDNPTNNAVIANGRLEINIRPSDLSVSPIATVRNAQDEQGFPTLEAARVQGVIHGPNFASSDSSSTNFSFTLIDGSNARDGIGLFINQADSRDFGIDSLVAQGLGLMEGDEVIIEGDIESFNGRMQITNPRFFDRVARNQSLQSPAAVNTLDEDTESRLIQLEGAIILDSTEWLGGPDFDGEGFNIRFARRGDTLIMRVDGDTELAQLTFSEAFGDLNIGYVITGFGGQFDNQIADGLLSGYQILPYRRADIVTSLPETLLEGSFSLFPNPSQSGIYQIRLAGEVNKNLGIKIYNAQGQLKSVVETNSPEGLYQLDLQDLPNGLYLLEIQVGNEKILKRVIKD